MGIDYLVCNFCDTAFPDVINYECCDCGRNWCGLECSENDGFTCDEETDERSCNFCRKEDFDNEQLLNKALDLLNISRDDLVKIMRG